MVDAEDFEHLSRYKWHMAHGYVVRSVKQPSGKRQVRQLAHFVISIPKGLLPDHINGNRLDNRKHNLRPATPALNSRNRKTHINNTSGFRGVCWHKRDKKWTAQIKVEGRFLFLGNYLDARTAALKYDTFAVKHFGKGCQLNFPAKHSKGVSIDTTANA